MSSTQSVNAQTDTVKYLFLGHPWYDDKKKEYVIKKVEKLDDERYDLLLLGGDLTWNTSALISTLDYCDQFFFYGAKIHVSPLEIMTYLTLPISWYTLRKRDIIVSIKIT